jgi:multimeric flavodoxin WrbA
MIAGCIKNERKTIKYFGKYILMKFLVINTLAEFDERSNKMIDSLNTKMNNVTIFDANKYKINNCTGCTHCWLKTPGVCAVKDDWEILFKTFLKSDTIIFIADARLGFISYKMKNIVDRLISLSLPYTKLWQGEMRHKRRYSKCWKIGLLYSGNADKEFLNEWMERFTLNFFCKSLGVYRIDESEEFCHEINTV